MSENGTPTWLDLDALRTRSSTKKTLQMKTTLMEEVGQKNVFEYVHYLVAYLAEQHVSAEQARSVAEEGTLDQLCGVLVGFVDDVEDAAALLAQAKKDVKSALITENEPAPGGTHIDFDVEKFAEAHVAAVRNADRPTKRLSSGFEVPTEIDQDEAIFFPHLHLQSIALHGFEVWAQAWQQHVRQLMMADKIKSEYVWNKRERIIQAYIDLLSQLPIPTSREE